MLKRKACERLDRWKSEARGKAMLVTGARRVGKTYLVEQFAQRNYEHVVKFDFVLSGSLLGVELGGVCSLPVEVKSPTFPYTPPPCSRLKVSQQHQ